MTHFQQKKFDPPHAELFEEDRKALLKLPVSPYEAANYITVKTNAYGKFSLNGGRHIYSTAPKHANTRVLIKITPYEVIPLDENHREIVRHQRFYGDSKQESMNWLPYLSQLSRCPGALKYSGVYSMLPLSVQEYLNGCSKRERSKVLKVLAEHGSPPPMPRCSGFNSTTLSSIVSIRFRVSVGCDFLLVL